MYVKITVCLSIIGIENFQYRPLLGLAPIGYFAGIIGMWLDYEEVMYTEILEFRNFKYFKFIKRKKLGIKPGVSRPPVRVNCWGSD